MKLYKNKQGNAWINVMVLLIVAVCLATLFSFLKSSDKVEAEVAGVDALNNVYLDESYFKFYFNEAGKSAVEQTYAKFSEDKIPSIDNFFGNYEEQFEKYGLDKTYLKKENFQIDAGKKVLKVGVNGWEASNQIDKNVRVLYRRNFIFEFLLK